MKNLIPFCLPLLLCCACIGRGALETGRPDAGEAGLGHGMIVLGGQLEDPYSVENMSEALASLYPTKAGRVVLPATDLYVRFLPENDAQWQRLRELGVEMLDHPVDYEIVREGDWYHDPSLPEDRITWQYAVVPRDFRFPPGIRHELLEECYIPDGTATKADGVDWDAVEDMRLNDVSDELEATGFKTVSYRGVSIPLVRPVTKITDNGWIGPDHPKYATEEWGRDMLDACARYIADFLGAFRRAPLP